MNLFLQSKLEKLSKSKMALKFLSATFLMMASQSILCFEAGTYKVDNETGNCTVEIEKVTPKKISMDRDECFFKKSHTRTMKSGGSLTKGSFSQEFKNSDETILVSSITVSDNEIVYEERIKGSNKPNARTVLKHSQPGELLYTIEINEEGIPQITDELILKKQ